MIQYVYVYIYVCGGSPTYTYSYIFQIILISSVQFSSAIHSSSVIPPTYQFSLVIPPATCCLLRLSQDDNGLLLLGDQLWDLAASLTRDHSFHHRKTCFVFFFRNGDLTNNIYIDKIICNITGIYYHTYPYIIDN